MSNNSILDKIGFKNYDIIEYLNKDLLWAEAIVTGAVKGEAELPLLESKFSLVIGKKEVELTEFDLHIDFGSNSKTEGGEKFDVNNYPGPWVISLEDIPLKLRVSRDVLKPVDESNQPISDPEKYSEIDFGELSFGLSTKDGILIDFPDGLSLPKSMIGNTGIIIEAENIIIDLSETEKKGVYIKELNIFWPDKLLPLPDGAKITGKDISIGSNGFSGTFSWKNENISYDEKFGVTGLDIEFKNNALISGVIKTYLNIGKFIDGSDKMPPIISKVLTTIGNKGILKIDFGITYDPDKEFPQSIGLLGSISSEQLLELFNGTTNGTSLTHLSFQKIGFEFGWDENNESYLKIITDILVGFKINSTEIKLLLRDQIFNILPNLSYEPGEIGLGKLWIDLPEEKGISLNNIFKATFSRVGFGKDKDGSTWVGFDARLLLPQPLNLGASVQGLKLYYPSGKTVFDGIGINLAIEGVIVFDGKFSWSEDEGKIGGTVKAGIVPLGMSLDGVLYIIKFKGEDAFYLAIDTEFPEGIPLFSTGASIYGLSGLFGYNMKPDKQSNESYYEWAKPFDSLVDPNSKWTSSKGDYAFGLGTVLGTTPDIGYSVNAKVALMVLMPGPTIMLLGKAKILSRKPSTKDGGEGDLTAIFVLDFLVGEFLLNIDASYKIPSSSGLLLDLHAGAEAYFNMGNPRIWHLYIGRCKKEQRIKTEFLDLFTATGFLMIDSQGIKCKIDSSSINTSGLTLAVGAECGFSTGIDWDVLYIWLEAWIGGLAVVGFDPVLFVGMLYAHGKLAVKVFGLGFSLGLDAELEAITPTPWYVGGKFRVCIGLPWPIPDIKTTVKLEWGSKKGELQPPERILSEVSAQERLGTKNVLLYNKDGNTNTAEVPMDAIINLVFAHRMNDSTSEEISLGKGTDVTGDEVEDVSDKYKYKYELTKISIGEKNILGKSRDIWGWWQLYPGTKTDKGKQVLNRLALFAETPLNYTQKQLPLPGREGYIYYEEQIKEDFVGFPCAVIKEPSCRCVDFNSIEEQLIITPLPIKEEGATQITIIPLIDEEVYHLLELFLYLYPSINFDYKPPQIETHSYQVNDQVNGKVGDKALCLGMFTMKFEEPSVVCAGIPEKFEASGISIDIEPSVEVSLWIKEADLLQVSCEFYSEDKLISSLNTDNTEVDVVGEDDIGTFHYKIKKYTCKNTDVPIERIKVKISGCYPVRVSPSVWLLFLCNLPVKEVKKIEVMESNTKNLTKLYEYIVDNKEKYSNVETESNYLFKPNQEYIMEIKTKYTITETTNQEDVILEENGMEELIEFKTKGPPEDLTPYIARTFPKDGAISVYYGYDLKVLFKVKYVEKMYYLDGEDEIEVRLFKKDGKELKIDNIQRDYGTWELLQDQKAWYPILKDAECIPGYKYSHNLLWRIPWTEEVKLAPRTSYKAELRRVKKNTDKELFSFQFTTSRYPNFKEHIADFNEKAWDILLEDIEEGWKEKLKERLKIKLGSNENNLQKLWKNILEIINEDDLLQDIWYNVFKLQYKPYPEKPEVDVIWIKASDNQYQPIALFIDGPEMLFDKERTLLELEEVNEEVNGIINYKTINCKTLRSRDGARALIFKDDFTAFKKDTTLKMLFKYIPIWVGDDKLSIGGEEIEEEENAVSINIPALPQQFYQED
jgi:hypothetical protein